MTKEIEFQRLVDQYYAELWSFASYCSMGQGEVEDILHEAFLAAFERMKKGEAFTGEPLFWLKAVIRNKSRSLWRKNSHLLASDSTLLEELIPTIDQPLEEMVRKEAEGGLHACIDLLGDEERSLLADRYGEGRRIEEMADRKQMKAKTLRVQLFRLRNRLKECLEMKVPKWNQP